MLPLSIYLFHVIALPISQPSISCVFILHYKFPLNISILVPFHTPVYPAPIFVPNYSGPVPFLVTKCGNENERGFPFVFYP
jgi:hypothetical protein